MSGTERQKMLQSKHHRKRPRISKPLSCMQQDFPRRQIARACAYLGSSFSSGFCLFFQFGNSLPYPFCLSRVSFTQLWGSNGFPFLSHCKHSTFARTNLAFSFGLFFPFRFIMFRFHIRSPLVQAEIPNVYRNYVTFLI
jgi:hypothetical protein